MAARKNERSRWRRLAPALVVGLCAFAGTAQAQFFGDRFYNDNYGGGYGGDRYQRYQRPREDFNFPFGDRFIRPAPPPADYSKAPPPRKLDNPPTTNVVVIGDSLADWLAYGLDETYTDQPDTGVVRKIKPTAGLVRYDAKNENLDWAQALKDTLAGEKPNAIVVMLGLNDRVPLKDRVVPKPAPAPAQAPGGTGQGAAGQSPAQGSTQTQGQGPAPAQGQAQGSGQEKGQAQSREQGQAEPAKPAQAAAQPSQAAQLAKADGEGGAPPASAEPVATGATFEFHTDKWAELYGRRVDEMINVLKARGVPILWVGAPALRGTKSTSDMAYLDEIYRERAEKAGIAYVDIWDGFVDEQGRYTVQGPDFEGQTRKLRTPDGVHFTKAGAVKLASYVDQELRRVMSKGVITPVALPAPDAAAPAKPAAAVGTHPDVGPVVPLAIGGGDGGGDLLGNGKPAQITSTDPVAAKVLTRGDAIAAPSGRADDFSWPRRGSNANAASGADAGPLPGPDQPAPSQAAPAAAPKKGADGKAGDTKASDGKASDAKSKAASDQSTPRPRRTPSATLDGAGVPRPPRDVGGGF